MAEQNKPKKRRLIHLLIAVLVLAAGIGVMVFLIVIRPRPERVELPMLPPLVTVQEIVMEDIPITVRGYGTVQSKAEVRITARVSGNVVEINPDFRNGGFVEKGEQLFRIEPRDYELAVERARASVAGAQVQLEIQQAEAQIARQEWEQLNPDQEPPSSLVLREPQVQQAQADLEAARAELQQALLELERTSITAPFDARIASRPEVELGQFVTAGQMAGTLYSTDAVELEVPLEMRELFWLDVPQMTESPGRQDQRGSPVRIVSELAGRQYQWQGFVSRTGGLVDPVTRLIPLIVMSPEPFAESPPLIPGMFVEVLIEGDILENAFAVPRRAVRDGDQVWVVEDERLRIREIEIGRTDRDYVYAVSGVADGDLLILSFMDMVTDGMRVRIERDENGSE